MTRLLRLCAGLNNAAERSGRLRCGKGRLPTAKGCRLSLLRGQDQRPEKRS